MLRNQTATLSVSHGEVVLISGPIASGKSLWLLRLAGIQPLPEDVCCRFDGLPWQADANVNLRMLPDDFELLWLGQVVADELSFGLKPRPSDQQMNQMLEAWRVPEVSLSASMKDLNRLQALRVALAALTMAEPDVLLLDNPTAVLPVEDGVLLRQDVRTWAKQTGMVVVAACNRWHDWRDEADQWWRCEGGKGDLPVKMRWEDVDHA